MELEINYTVWIDTDEILKGIKKGLSLNDAIEDYVSGLDDADYYLIGSTEIEKIKNFILSIDN